MTTQHPLPYILLAFTLLSLFCTPQTTFAWNVGYQELSHPASGMLWYPIAHTQSSGEHIPDAPFLKALPGTKDAPIARQRTQHPLLLLSHGSGAVAKRLGWIAHAFAKHGWIVAAINHPGNTYGDNSAYGLATVWRRAEHISQLLDTLLTRHPLREHIDTSRIFAAGHSAGGTAMLLLAGGRFEATRFQNPLPHCVPPPPEYDDEDCAGLHQLDFQAFSADVVEGTYHDKRIRAVVALDPAFAQSFARDAPLLTPTAIMLADRLKHPAGEIYTALLPTIFPSATTLTIAHAIHISFVSRCTASAITRDIPLCTGDAAHRESIQRKTLRFMRKFFRQAD